MWKKYIVTWWILILKKWILMLNTNACLLYDVIFYSPFRFSFLWNVCAVCYLIKASVTALLDNKIQHTVGQGQTAIYKKKTTVWLNISSLDWLITLGDICSVVRTHFSFLRNDFTFLESQTLNESAQERLIGCAETGLKVPINMHQVVVVRWIQGVLSLSVFICLFWWLKCKS